MPRDEFEQRGTVCEATFKRSERGSKLPAKELKPIRIDVTKLDPRTTEGLDKIKELAMFGATHAEIAALMCIDASDFKDIMRRHPEVRAAFQQGAAIGSVSAKARVYEQGVVEGKNGPLSLYVVNTTDFAYAGRPQESRVDAQSEMETEIKSMSEDDLKKALATGIRNLGVKVIPELIGMVIEMLPEAERAAIKASGVIPSHVGRSTEPRPVPKLTPATPQEPEIIPE